MVGGVDWISFSRSAQSEKSARFATAQGGPGTVDQPPRHTALEDGKLRRRPHHGKKRGRPRRGSCGLCISLIVILLLGVELQQSHICLSALILSNLLHGWLFVGLWVVLGDVTAWAASTFESTAARATGVPLQVLPRRCPQRRPTLQRPHRLLGPQHERSTARCFV